MSKDAGCITYSLCTIWLGFALNNHIESSAASPRFSGQLTFVDCCLLAFRDDTAGRLPVLLSP